VAARARPVDIPGRAARLKIDADHPAGPATDAQAATGIGGDVYGAIINREPLWVVAGIECRHPDAPYDRRRMGTGLSVASFCWAGVREGGRPICSFPTVVGRRSARRPRRCGARLDPHPHRRRQEPRQGPRIVTNFQAKSSPVADRAPALGSSSTRTRSHRAIDDRFIGSLRRRARCGERLAQGSIRGPIEDFLEGFNQPTYRNMRVNGSGWLPDRAGTAGARCDA
jgi:hypothetical protein